MNEGTMHCMPKGMEYKYLTEDSEIRIYLSQVREEKSGAREEGSASKMMAAAIKLSYSLATACAVGQWAVRSAAETRGYDAVGGEYILAIAVFLGSFSLVSKLLEIYRRRG